MSNPLRLFRKYQAFMLVVFGIALMFAFVVGPVLTDYFSSSAGMGSGAGVEVVSWKGGELSESDMSGLRTVHLQATRFLRELVSRVRVIEDDVVVKRKGQDVQLIKGRTYTVVAQGRDNAGQMQYQIVVDGEVVLVPETKAGSTDPQVLPIRPRAQLITQATGEEELVQRILLAEEAKKLGLIIGSDAVIDYLDCLCDVAEETRPDYGAMLNRSTNGHLEMRRFIGHISMELAAQRMLLMSRGGLYAIPPDVLYQCYNKLHRRVTAEMLAVDVKEFLNEVGEPSEEDVKSLYEKGKDRFPNPAFSEPGFKKRKEIAFQFVVGTFDDFLQREKEQISPTITDEDIEQYYAENKEEFKIIELPDDESTEEGGAESPEAGSEAEMTEPAKTEPAKTEPAKTEPAKTEPAKTEPAKTEPVKTEPVKTEPVKTEPAKTEPAKTEPVKTEPAKTEPAKTEASEPEESNASSEEGTQEQASIQDDGFMLVSYQEPAAQEEPAKKTESGGEVTAVETPGAGAAEPKQEDPKVESAKEADTAGPETAGPETAGPETAGPETAGPETAVGDAAAKPEATDGETTEPKEKPAQYKPLDDERRVEIREKLASQLARMPAQEKLEAAISSVRSQVEKYSRDLAVSEALDGKDPPAPLDMKGLAKEYQLQFATTPLWDALAVSTIRQADPSDSEPPAYELARATETVWSQAGQYRRSLTDVAFPTDLSKYTPRTFVDGIVMPGSFPIPPQKLFLYWRVKEVEEKTPELEDAPKKGAEPGPIRSQVIRAWKMQQALPLAQTKAEQMAKEVNAANKPLNEVFPDSEAKVIRTMLFSWMTRGAVPGGMGGRPMLSPVNGMANEQPVNVSGAGNDFMRSVFSLDVGQAGAATDEAHSFVYVVRVESEDLSDEERRDAFYTTGLTPDIGSLVEDEQMEIIRDWFDGIEDAYALKWARPSNNDWNIQQ